MAISPSTTLSKQPVSEPAERYAAVRRRSLRLAAPLSPEDQVAQSMPDASPTKWHLAHTTWFFETFILAARPGYAVFDPTFNFLFNSYYEAVGPRHERAKRGLLTRPSSDAVRAYRAHVDAAMAALLESETLSAGDLALVALGLSHEEQHQELILTDVLHLLAQNPTLPAYDAGLARAPVLHSAATAAFIGFDGGVVDIGRSPGEEAFGFDSESPRHAALLRPFRLADRLVTNAEWAAFIDDGGYRRAELWLSDGWSTVCEERWTAPFHWRANSDESGWMEFTLAGLIPPAADAPVCHVSYYEAEAFARWCGKRLPTEQEWEHAAAVQGAADDADRPLSLPAPVGAPNGELRQLFGTAWQWTASPYVAYPGFRPAAGAVGEYNGKFMVNQMVLKGGSLATPPGHSSRTYRNFFHPQQRWQFTGVRLAEDV